ncbi:nitrogen fixation negative regulator NifL [Pseudaeromonas sharmana]|uniref:Nitrogen fixation negative regulator NifL n=1 Tax=Pseudaeromonas sharmana TaxID=328412 RepID=A0ABV8CKB0_9GAMM
MAPGSMSLVGGGESPAGLVDSTARLDSSTLQGLMTLLPPSLFLEVVEQSSIAISITDPEARIIYSNQAFSRLTGFSRSELKGRNHNVLASQQTPRSRYQAMWSALEAKRAWSGRLINKRKDGSLYLAEVTVTPVLDNAGHISHFLGMHKDISERHALDQRLHNQMALLEAVLNAAPMAVAVLDDNEQILLDNLAYKTLRSDLNGSEPAVCLQQVLPHVSPAGVFLPLRIRQQTHWYTLTRLPIESLSEEAGHYFGHGRRTFSLLLIQDCTQEFVRLEQARLEQLRLRLDEQRLLLVVEETLQAASLKLRAPLNLLQAAERLEPGNQLNPAVRAAREEGERAWQWLQDSRPAPAPEAHQVLSLAPLLSDVEALLQTRLQSGQLFELVLPDAALNVDAQPLRLTLALWQLLEQLRLRLPADGGTLRLTSQINEQNVCLLLEDSGPAIEELADYHSLPFSCLWQRNEGAELALSLVQEIVNDHNGIIAVMASALGGVQIHLELPLMLDDRRS